VSSGVDVAVGLNEINQSSSPSINQYPHAPIVR